MSKLTVEYKLDSSNAGFAVAGDEVSVSKENVTTVKGDMDQGNLEETGGLKSAIITRWAEKVQDDTSYEVENPDEVLEDDGTEGADGTKKADGEEGEGEEKEGGEGGAAGGGGVSGGAALGLAMFASTSAMVTNQVAPVLELAGVDLGLGITQLATSIAGVVVSSMFDPMYDERVSQAGEEESKESEIDENINVMDEDIETLDQIIEELEEEGEIEEEDVAEAESDVTIETPTEEEPQAVAPPPEVPGEEDEEVPVVNDEDAAEVDQAVETDEEATEMSEVKGEESVFMKLGHALASEGTMAAGLFAGAAALNLTTAGKTLTAAGKSQIKAAASGNPFTAAFYETQAALDVAATTTLKASSVNYGASSLIMTTKAALEAFCGEKGDDLDSKLGEMAEKQSEHQAKVELLGGEIGGEDDGGEGDSGGGADSAGGAGSSGGAGGSGGGGGSGGSGQ